MTPAQRDDKPMKPWGDVQAELAADRAKLGAGARWYLAHCHTRTDRVARDQLAALGFRPYMPQLRRMKTPPRDKLSRKQREQISTLRRPVIEPLFPRYLFLDMNLRNDPWRDVFRTIGISGLACDEGDMPLPLPAGFVEGLQAHERDGALPHNTLVSDLMAALCKTSRMLQEQTGKRVKAGEMPFRIGQLVRIKHGPLSGFCGPVQELPPATEVGDLDESARVTVFADLFGRSVPVDLELWQVEGK